MSARVEVPVVTVGWESVESALAQLRTGGEEFEQFINEQLDGLFRLNQQLDARRQQLDQREQAIRTEREDSQKQIARAESERDAENTARLAQLAAELDAARGELTAARSELGVVQASAQRDVDAAVQQANELRAAADERDELSVKLDRVQKESTQLAGAAEELETIRAELAAVRAELAERKRQASSTAAPPDEETARRLQSLEQERSALETELEHVRIRAAETADALDEQKRRSTVERAEWSGELKQLRRTLERQSQLLAERRHETPTVATPPAAKSNDRHSSDPVLDSVMAQFETLQKDLIRRRNQKSRPGRSGVA